MITIEKNSKGKNDFLYFTFDDKEIYLKWCDFFRKNYPYRFSYSIMDLTFTVFNKKFNIADFDILDTKRVGLVFDDFMIFQKFKNFLKLQAYLGVVDNSNLDFRIFKKDKNFRTYF